MHRILTFSEHSICCSKNFPTLARTAISCLQFIFRLFSQHKLVGLLFWRVKQAVKNAQASHLCLLAPSASVHRRSSKHAPFCCWTNSAPRSLGGAVMNFAIICDSRGAGVGYWHEACWGHDTSFEKLCLTALQSHSRRLHPSRIQLRIRIKIS